MKLSSKYIIVGIILVFIFCSLALAEESYIVDGIFIRQEYSSFMEIVSALVNKGVIITTNTKDRVLLNKIELKNGEFGSLGIEFINGKIHSILEGTFYNTYDDLLDYLLFEVSFMSSIHGTPRNIFDEIKLTNGVFPKRIYSWDLGDRYYTIYLDKSSDYRFIRITEAKH